MYGRRIGQYSHLKQYVIHVLFLVKSEPQKDEIGNGQSRGDASNENDEPLPKFQWVEPVVAADAKEGMIIEHILYPISAPAVSWEVVCSLGQSRHDALLFLRLLSLVVFGPGVDRPYLFSSRHRR